MCVADPQTLDITIRGLDDVLIVKDSGKNDSGGRKTLGRKTPGKKTLLNVKRNKKDFTIQIRTPK
jgi:hypothetical protein